MTSGLQSVRRSVRCSVVGKGSPLIRILGGGLEFFLKINIFVGKMGEVNNWPQGVVEIQPSLR